MKFLGDMGVSHHVVEWLRQSGHDAVHLREEGLQVLPDADIFSKAEAGLEVGMMVRFTASRAGIRIVPLKARMTIKLAELLESCEGRNPHREVVRGVAGREIF